MITSIRKLYFLFREIKHTNDFNKLKNKILESGVFLHLGCGPRVLKNWINIDLFFEPYKDYLKFYGEECYPKVARGSIDDFYGIDIVKKGLPLKDNSVDLIFHEDFIEHLSQKEQVILLSETFRVLKPGCIHRINTPDLLSAMKKSDFTLGAKGVYVNEWDAHGHVSLMTKNSLLDLCSLIGYSKIVFNNKNQSISKDVPREYRPDEGDREEDGNIFVDLIK